MNNDRKSQILKAAAVLIKEKGYDGTSMRDLASTIAMEASSLYNHISSKDQILKLICFDMAEKFDKGLAEVNDIYFNAEEKLHLAVKNHILILTENPDKSYVFINEWRKLDPSSLQEFIVLRDKYEQGISEILKNGEEEGLFNEGDKKFAVLTILSSLNWIVEWYKPNGSMTAEQIANKLTDFILTGLRK